MPWSSARLLVCVATVSILAVGLSACGGGGGSGSGTGGGGTGGGGTGGGGGPGGGGTGGGGGPGGGGTTPPNPPPVLGTLTFSTKEGTSLSAQVTASDPHAVTAATEGTLHLKGFVVSDNGATVVYRREDTAAASTTDLWFLQTASSAAATKIPLPAGATPVQDGKGADQFQVSPDGKWIALIASTSGVGSVYVLNVGTPATLTKVSPVGAASAAQLRFSSDSKNLYFLASADAGGANKSLYLVSPANPIAPTPVSALSVPNTNDDVIDYRISPDQARVVLQANRGGRVGLYFVDARQLQTEVQISQALAFGEVISDSTLSRNGGTVTGAPLQRVAYTVKTLLGAFNTYVADVSATPNARLIANGTQAVGLSPGDSALLYSKGLQIWENSIGAGTADSLVEAGSDAWYDSTGNVVLVRQFLPSGGSPSSYPALAVTTRGTFGSSLPLGTPGLAADYVDVSGFDRVVVIVGEGPTTGAMPTSPRLALINALAPDKLFYLADHGSPQQLTSPGVRVVAAN